MNKPHFISILDYATLNVHEIQVLNVIETTIRVWVKDQKEPFLFNFDTPRLAMDTFNKISQLLRTNG